MEHEHDTGWRKSRGYGPLLACVAVLSLPVTGLVSALAGGHDVAGLLQAGAIKPAFAKIWNGGTDLTAPDLTLRASVPDEAGPEAGETVITSRTDRIETDGTPVAVTPVGIEAIRHKYGSILPEQISIPSTVPDLSRIVTVAQALAPEADVDEMSSSPVMRYALGGDGVSPEVAAAFQTVQKARAGEIRSMGDAEVVQLALGRIGYVPAGVNPDEVRVPGGALEGPGRRVVEGMANIISGHLIMVGEDMIRLQGVRSAGLGDICTNAAGTEYDCAAWSKEGLQHLLADHDLRCAVTSDAHEEGGFLGWCNITVSGRSYDIASLAVRSGILMAVEGGLGTSPYDADQEAASERKIGLWSGAVDSRSM